MFDFDDELLNDDVSLVFVRSSRRADLQRIRDQLCEIAEKEATRLYRLAWRMQEHGCSQKAINKVREEARALHMTGCPERLIDDSVSWEYAFKI